MLDTQIQSLTRNEGEQLAPVVKQLWIIQWIIVTVIFVPAVFFASRHYMAELPVRVPAWLVTLLFFLIFRLPGLLLLPKTYENWRYSINSEFVSISHGVLTRTIRTLPLPRLQYVDVSSGVLENMLGIATIAVYAAAGEGRVIQIPGISKERAELIRADVLRLKGEHGGV